jgi:hypothetical protein
VGQQASLFGAPPVAVQVIAFDLVRGCCSAPQKPVGKAHHLQISTHLHGLGDGGILFFLGPAWHNCTPFFRVLRV